jgi:hypothetical protein
MADFDPEDGPVHGDEDSVEDESDAEDAGTEHYTFVR